MVGFPLLCYYVSLPDGNWVVRKFNWDSSWFVTHQDSFFFPMPHLNGCTVFHRQIVGKGPFPLDELYFRISLYHISVRKGKQGCKML